MQARLLYPVRTMAALAAALIAGMAMAAPRLPIDGPIEHAPAWSLKTPGGDTVHYPDDARGRPTVLMFWPSWCPFSRALQPYVQDVWEDYRDRGVNVWTINIREDGDPVQTMKDRGLSFPLLLNGDPLMDPYGIQRTPWLVVMDGDNRIVYTRPANPPSPIEVARRIRSTLNALIGDRAVPMPTSWPKPYDLHLKPRADRIDRTRPKSLPASIWQPWLQQYLAGVGPEAVVAGIEPLGPIGDGKSAIEHARRLWTERWGEEAVQAQAPYRAYRDATRWVVLGNGLDDELGTGMILVVERESGRVLRITQ